LLFTPTSASWLNMVEQSSATSRPNELVRQLHNVPQLEQAIEDYIAGHNAAPTPFI
jgi:hypothetical protein